MNKAFHLVVLGAFVGAILSSAARGGGEPLDPSVCKANLIALRAAKAGRDVIQEVDAVRRKLGYAAESTPFYRCFNPDAYWNMLNQEVSPDAPNRNEVLLTVGAYGLTRDEVVALRYYSISSGDINFYLRKPHAANADAKRNKVIVDVLLSALRKLPRYTGIAYRGTIKWKGDKLPKKGDIWVPPTVLSSTGERDRLSPHFDDPIIYEIHSKTGRYIEMFKRDSEEEEVVFLPRTRFRCVRVEKNKKVPGLEGTKTYIILEEI